MPQYHKVSILKDLPLKFVCIRSDTGLLSLPLASEIAFTDKKQDTDTYPLKILEVIDF